MGFILLYKNHSTFVPAFTKCTWILFVSNTGPVHPIFFNTLTYRNIVLYILHKFLGNYTY